MSGVRLGWASIVLGALALAAIPVGVVFAGRIVSVDLLHATCGAVATSFVFGLAGISISRRARFRVERSLNRRGARTVRYGRVLVFAGLYVAVIGAIALAFYGVVLAFS